MMFLRLLVVVFVTLFTVATSRNGGSVKISGCSGGAHVMLVSATIRSDEGDSDMFILVVRMHRHYGGTLII